MSKWATLIGAFCCGLATIGCVLAGVIDGFDRNPVIFMARCVSALGFLGITVVFIDTAEKLWRESRSAQ